MATNTHFRCPIVGCTHEGSRRGRADFIEHIESHTQPYACSVKNCGLRFSRITNLNRHRQTQHLIHQEYNLKTIDVLVEGEIHHRIRRHQTVHELILLLQHLGFTCS
ncbi:hypothetical protein EV426DRAFT_593153 [Tirmania nivea]|nr:hypothetical protein EV426DRAFT_593153 [Tirmania nivea]